MLKEIRCDKFNKETVTFQKGLNVVLGDDVASNSIGKSTMLMIIDFVFGGDSYITTNQDAIQNLGHHEFKFHFEFDEKLYFTRNTEEYRYVNQCNEKYETIKQIKTDEYTAILKDKYNIQIDDISFRDVVGRYSRVWGKENLDIAKPLQYFRQETNKLSITALIKLFDKYKIIKAYEKQLDKLSDEKLILNKAAKSNFIPQLTKSLYTNNQKNIEQYGAELESLKKNILELSTDVETLVSKEILELQTIKSQLVKQKNIYENRLRRTRKNLANKNFNMADEFYKLTQYFTNVDINKLTQVEEFHNAITNILKEELKKAEKEIVGKIEYILTEIEQIDTQISEKLNIKDAPKYAVDRIVEVSAKIQQLENESTFYTKSKEIADNLKIAKTDLSTIKSDILADISSQINIKMNELNKLIYPDNRRSPVFDLKGDSYVFKTFSDTGTGTAYANLITFDLAILNLTALPILIHDLPLFKNVENVAMENIIGIYNVSNEQIFIALDEIPKFKPKTTKILRENSFVQLSKDKTLFIKNWKNTNEEKVQSE
jgi:hypothetical protein